MTIDWQEMEGSTYLATPLPPPKSINHRGYPLRVEMEAPERKQLVLGAKKHRLENVQKIILAILLKMIYTLTGQASTGGFNLKLGDRVVPPGGKRTNN